MKEKDFVRRYRLRIPKGACPRCGCKNFSTIDHYAPYPDVFCETRCDYCGQVVKFQDNSPVIDFIELIRHSGVRSKKKILELLSQY